MVFLRIDPLYFNFTVETASSEKQSLPLEAWATRKGLIAATNASMYLPDGVTSTGYLRTGETVNNGRVVSKFGAFFVAGPDSPDFPGADLLDRSTDDWENLLPLLQYGRAELPPRSSSDPASALEARRPEALHFRRGP